MKVLIPTVSSFIILDSEGARLLAKYYDGRNKAEQVATEDALHKKSKQLTAKGSKFCYFLLVYDVKCHLHSVAADVVVTENEIAMCRSGVDLKMFVTGSLEEVLVVMLSVM